jgi:hypothetical protein
MPIVTPAGEQESPASRSFQITFREPTKIRHVQLVFREWQFARTQEFTLRCSVGAQRREVIRQQWRFCPQGSTEEVEDYSVSLNDVVVLELAIIPDINNSGALASLLRLRIG